jgi:hypothetical protein
LQTIEISIGKPPQQLSLQAGIVEGPDTSGAHTEMPGVLDDWLKAQKTVTVCIVVILIYLTKYISSNINHFYWTLSREVLW